MNEPGVRCDGNRTEQSHLDVMDRWPVPHIVLRWPLKNVSKNNMTAGWVSDRALRGFEAHLVLVSLTRNRSIMTTTTAATAQAAVFTEPSSDSDVVF